MKKFLCTLLTALAVLAVLAVVSCGGAPAPAPAAAPAPASAPAAATDLIMDGARYYTTVGGDCLSSVAEREYGNKYYFPIIQRASGITTNPDLIYSGLRLTLVDIRRNLADAGAKARVKQYITAAAASYDNRNSSVAAEMRNFANGL
ncbi:MAG: hypothetical protein LBJ31_08130 [Treponema sp.]|nr:hypothetical protein [Treponema sp.]